MGVSLPARRTTLLGTLLGLLVGIASPSLSEAAEGIGVVDYQAIFEKFDGTADAQRTLDRELKDWEQEGRDMRDEIDRLSEELESQRLMLSEERLQVKQDELKRQRDEYERFIESVFGSNGKAARRNAELTKPIAEKILEVIARIGREQRLSVILDAGTGGVVWAEDEVNVTKTILDELAISVGTDDEEGSTDERADERPGGEGDDES